MAAGRLDGYERTFLEEASRIAGLHFDPQRVVLPWGLLARDVTASGSGGALVASEKLSALGALLPSAPS